MNGPSHVPAGEDGSVVKALDAQPEDLGNFTETFLYMMGWEKP